MSDFISANEAITISDEAIKAQIAILNDRVNKALPAIGKEIKEAAKVGRGYARIRVEEELFNPIADFLRHKGYSVKRIVPLLYPLSSGMMQTNDGCNMMITWKAR